MENKKKSELINFSIKKYLDTEQDSLVVVLRIDEKLKSLLNFFAVRDDVKEVSDGELKSCERYLIKSVIRGSCLWNNNYDYFFSKDLIDKGETKIYLQNKSSYRDFLDKISSFKEIIVEMFSLKEEEKVNVTLNIEY